MYLFYTYEQLVKMAIFSSIDFTLFSQFEIVIFTLIANLFYLSFVAFCISIIYKAVNRLVRFIF